MTITLKQIENNSNPNLPSDLRRLDRAALIDALRIVDELQRRHCANDPEYWLFRYARTRDEHDATVTAKPFPDKEYLHVMVRFWLEHRMNLFEKSRQMMATWTLSALYMHDAQLHDKPAALHSVEKGGRLRPADPAVLHNLGEPARLHQTCSFRRIRLLPSLVLSPGGVSWASVLRNLGHSAGRRCHPPAHRFRGTCRGSSQVTREISIRTTSLGFHVLRLHFSSDPDKEPATETGCLWMEQAKSGMSDARWRKEFEIDYGALSGQLVFPEFDPGIHVVENVSSKA